MGQGMRKDPSLDALGTLSLVFLTGKALAWLSVYVGYPVHWTTWSVFVAIALWATIEVGS